MSELDNVSVIFHTAICSLLFKLSVVGLMLELDVQKEETMHALLVLLVFVLYDAQLAIPNTIVVCHHLGLWAGYPTSSR